MPYSIILDQGETSPAALEPPCVCLLSIGYASTFVNNRAQSRRSMHLPIHLALSWLVAHKLPDRRDRRLVTWAGVVPDVDALAVLGGVGSYVEYHHVLTHGVLAATAVTATFAYFGRDRIRVALFSLLTFHLHLLCDLVGSGAQGQPWPIAYFWPWSRREFFSPYGWDLASPQNAVVWLIAVAFTALIAARHGRTFGEAFLPARADAKVAQVLARFIPRWSALKQ